MPDYAAASRQDRPVTRRSSMRCSTRGVYLPPSAFEAWFLTAAHDDRALDRSSTALPARRGGRAGGGQRGQRRLGETDVVHLVRHGEVHNPDGVLYGRLPDYHLSELGREMADRVADDLRGRDIVHLVCSPLERAQETMEPIAEALGLAGAIDGRVIEAANSSRARGSASATARCAAPSSGGTCATTFGPTWGEPYREIVARMRLAMRDARRPRPGTRRDRLATSCRSGWPGATPRAAGCGTTRASGSARWPASPRSPIVDEPGRLGRLPEPAAELLGRTGPRSSSPGRRSAHPGRLRAGTLLVLLLGVAGCSAGHGERGRRGSRATRIVGRNLTLIPPEDRQPVPEVTGPDLDGEALRPQAYPGKVVVINVWGSWCPPCAARRRPTCRRPGRETAAVRSSSASTPRTSTKARRRRFVRENKITYPSIYDPSGQTLLAFAGALPPSAIPSTLILDREGPAGGAGPRRGLHDHAGRHGQRCRGRCSGAVPSTELGRGRSGRLDGAGLPIALLAGLVSFFSPCVVPLLPGYLSYATGLSAAEVVEGRPAWPDAGRGARCSCSASRWSS